MACRQEWALLTGARLSPFDPCVLAAAGGVQTARASRQGAMQTVMEKVNELGNRTVLNSRLTGGAVCCGPNFRNDAKLFFCISSRFDAKIPHSDGGFLPVSPVFPGPESGKGNQGRKRRNVHQSAGFAAGQKRNGGGDF